MPEMPTCKGDLTGFTEDRSRTPQIAARVKTREATRIRLDRRTKRRDARERRRKMNQEGTRAEKIPDTG